MTSEVCAMNRRAAVLAADSAVTVERWESGKKEERYFKGANKIFELSDFQPIGLMIFDEAELHGMPWETIVKAFRAQLGNKKCGNIEGYAKEFFDFVASANGVFSGDYRNQIFVELVDRGMVRSLQEANSDASVRTAPDQASADKARNAILDDLKKLLDGAPLGVALPQAEIDALVTLNEAKLKQEAAIDFDFFAKGSTYSIDDLINIGVQSVFKLPADYLPSTGVVLAGYGDDDYFPAYKEYLCRGLIGSTVLYELKEQHSIGPNSSGHISTFAQSAMVNTFYLGFSSDVLTMVKKEARDRLPDFAAKVLAATGGSSPIPGLDGLVDAFVSEHTSAWTKAIVERHAQPFRRVIGSLPVDEMASLAETLVMLESLKEKVTKPSESVGGPIDVAVITKAEGFLWIKRKHFFDPKINHRYFTRQQARLGV